MPAIGASTTGVSTRSDPRVSEVGSDMPPLSPGTPAPAKPASALTPLGVAALGLAALPLPALGGGRLRGHRLLQVTGPGDRVERLRRPEAHRGQVALARGEVDQAHVGLRA